MMARYPVHLVAIHSSLAVVVSVAAALVNDSLAAAI